MQKGIDYPGITVSYMCHDGRGNFVMNKRGVNCRDEHGAWDFGGGGLDFGVSVEDTLFKEIKEEYCATPISYKFLGYANLFREHAGKKTHWVGLYFLVELNRAEVKNGEPHKFDDIGWFRLDALPTPLHSAIPAFLEKYKNQLG